MKSQYETMKNIFLSTLLFLSCYCTILAQTNSRPPSRVKKPKPIYEQVNQTVKLNVPSLLFKTIAVQYEKKMSRKTSFAAGVIFRPNSAIPFKNFLLNDTLFTVGLSTREMLKTTRYSTFMITPEFRYYFRKKALRGLYMAPFLRYKNENLNADYKYSDTNSFFHTGSLKGKVNTIGAGVLFGLQVLTKKKISIDFWFAGPWISYSKYKSSSKINTAYLDVYRKAAVESIIEPYNEIFGFSNEFQWTPTGFETNKGSLGLGFRFFGINLGYAF